MASLYSNGAPSAIEAGSMGKRQWEREQQAGVRRQRFFGNVMRNARRRGDMETYLRAESMGFRDPGIADFKESREQAAGWVEKRRGLGEQFLVGGSASNAPAGGSGASGAPSAGMSFAEQEAAARERSNASGAFGDKTPIVSKSLAEQRRDFATKAKGIEAMGDSAEDQERLRNQAFAKGKQLGLNDDQIEAALRGSVGTKSTTTAKPEKRGYEESDRIISEQLAGDNRELKESLAYLKQQTDDATAKSDQASIDTALTAQEGKDRLRELNMKQTKDSTERNLQRLASEELARLQKSRTDDYLRDDKAPDAFAGRIFDSWQSDPSLQLTDAELKEAANDPSRVSDIVQRKVSQRDAVDSAFNKALGGKPKTQEGRKIYDGRGNVIAWEKGEAYESDSFGKTKLTALGLKPNLAYGGGPFYQLGASAGKDQLVAPIDQSIPKAWEYVDNAQRKIINAALDSGYPIWEDNDLMSNKQFRFKVESNPVLKQRMDESKRQKKEGDRSARILAAFNSI